MSLINQMLKDIDKRQGLPASSFEEDSSFKPTMPRARGVSPARLVLWGGGLLVAVGAVGWGVYQWRVQAARPQGAPAAQAKASAVPNEAPVVTAITVDDKAKAASPVPEAASASKKAPETAQAAAPASARSPVKVAVAEEAKPAPKAPPTAAPAAVTAPAPAASAAPKVATRTAAASAPNPVAAPASAAAPARPVPVQASAKAAASKSAPAAPGLVSRVISAEQRADNAYREAGLQARQGHVAEAQRLLRQALAEQATHQDARLYLSQLLMDEGKRAEAKSVLAEGVALKPQGPQLYVALAQAQLLSKETDAAIATLERGGPAVSDNAQYQALMAAALQQKSRHPEAVQYYIQALRQQPEASHWLVGLAVSLQATGNNQGAAEAYQRALDLGLSPTLGQFAREKLNQLGR